MESEIFYKEERFNKGGLPFKHCPDCDSELCSFAMNHDKYIHRTFFCNNYQCDIDIIFVMKTKGFLGGKN